MAIERWLYSNAKFADSARQEFQPRLCDKGLRGLMDPLTDISVRMIDTSLRNDPSLRTQRCWFAGYLDSDRYMVALAGEQNTLLGTQYQSGRGLFCMMALVFSGEDAALYEKKEGLFDPLKALMRQVNKREDARCDREFSESELIAHCREYRAAAQDVPFSDNDMNIMSSEEASDDALWQQSLHRPAALGILSRDHATRLLDKYPDWRVTVMEKNVRERYQPTVRLSALEIRMLQEQQAREAEVKEPAPVLVNTESIEKPAVTTVKKIQKLHTNAIPGWVWVALAAVIVALMIVIFGGGNSAEDETLDRVGLCTDCSVAYIRISSHDLLYAETEDFYAVS